MPIDPFPFEEPIQNTDPDPQRCRNKHVRPPDNRRRTSRQGIRIRGTFRGYNRARQISANRDLAPKHPAPSICTGARGCDYTPLHIHSDRLRKKTSPPRKERKFAGVCTFSDLLLRKREAPFQRDRIFLPVPAPPPQRQTFYLSRRRKADSACFSVPSRPGESG